MSILTQLPLELRLKVLGLVVGGTAVPHAKRLLLGRPDPHPNPELAIASVNNQLYRETMPIVYSQVTFSFYTSTQLRLFFAANYQDTHCSIRMINLHLCPEILLLFLRAGSGCNHPSDMVRYFWLKTFPMTARRLSIYRLCVHIPQIHESHRKKLGETNQTRIEDVVWRAGLPLLMNVAEVDFQDHLTDALKARWLQILGDWRLERLKYLG